MNPTIRLLYAEDNPQDVDLTRAHFAAHAPEFELEIVGTGQRCLERLREARFDLLLLDHRLPDMDGLEVLKLLLHAGLKLPVVMVTGVGDEEVAVKALRLGAVNYVAKQDNYLETLLNLLRDVVAEQLRGPGKGLPAATTPRRILYVEHLPMDIELTLRHIAEAAPHFTVEVVRTCAEALTRLAQPPAYDLVLVDLRMPDQSGLDFVREAKRRRLPLPPFIMVSGAGDEVTATATLKLGAADFITKREGYLNQLPHTMDRAIAYDHLNRFNEQLQVELEARRQAEAALREAEQRYRDLFDQANEGLFLMTPEGHLTEVNRAFAEMHGYTVAEMKNLDVRALDVLHEQALADRADILRRVQAGETVRFEVEHHHKDGHRFPLAVTVSLINLDGQSFYLAFHQDITERKQTEAALKILATSFAHLSGKLFFEAVSRHIATSLGVDFVFVGELSETQDAVSAVGGYARGEAMGELTYALADTPCENVVGKQMCIIPRAVQSQFPKDLLLVQMGIESYLGAPVFDKQHQPIGILVALHSKAFLNPKAITGLFSTLLDRVSAEMQRGKAEEALGRSEDRMRLFFERQLVGMAITSPAKGWLQVNDRLCAMLGYAREELIRLTWAELTHPEDLASDVAQFDRLLAGDIDNYTLEKRFIHQDGKWVHTNLAVACVRHPAGPVDYVLALMEDITERKRMEEAHARLAMAVEQAAESIVITDTSGTILYANPAFEKVSGYTRAETLGQNPRLLKSGQQEAEFYRRMWEALKRGQVWHGHFCNKHKNGNLYEEDATISPVRDATGTIVNYVAVKRDVTRELELAAQFRQAQKMEAIGQLAGGIAHDFNNILSVILGNTELAVMDTDPSHPARASLIEIETASRRAQNLVRQILTYCRQQPQDRQVIPLEPIIAEAAKFLHATIPSGVEIVLALAASVPPVRADATQIHQVLFNLCTNAWHALEDQPGRIGIQLQTVTLDAAAAERLAGLRPGRFACLSISDTGKGMDAAMLECIFNPFFTTKAPGKGTGLGLSVVQGIVAAHDGAITVVSQPGQGSTFQVYFPTADTGTADSEIVSEGPVPPGQGQHVLFLDDEETLVRLATLMLERLGYRATGFTHAAAAVQAFRANPSQFDVAITDLNMPGTSGLDVARELLTVRPDLPVLLCSGYVTEQMRAQARSADIRRVLYKPYTMEEFSAALHHLFTQPRQP